MAFSTDDPVVRSLQRAATRLRTAIELHESGVAMKRAQLRRAVPVRSAATIEREVAAWLSERPGAERGDVTIVRSSSR